MDIKKIYMVLLIAVLVSIFSTLLCLFYEIPCLVILKFGGAQTNSLEIIRNIRNLRFSFGASEVIIFMVIVLLRFAVMTLLFMLCSALLKRMLIPFYLKFYQVLLGLLFFLPSLLLYTWVLFLGVNFFWFIAIALLLPALVIFLLIFIFKEIRKTEKIVSDLDIDLLVNNEDPVK